MPSGRALSRLGFPAIVAHRGASSTRPENTLASFEEAIALGAQIVELDIRLSRDGVPVVMHDPVVDRTTDGTGFVHELTAAEIASLRVGKEERVPTFAEVLEVASGRAALAVEIKSIPGEPAYDPAGEPIVAAVHAELGRSAFGGVALVISFNPSSIEASKGLA